jgi:hypothetical protein
MVQKKAIATNRGPPNAPPRASTQGHALHPAPNTQQFTSTQANPQRTAPPRQEAISAAQQSKPPSVPESQTRLASNKSSEAAKSSAAQILEIDIDEDDDGDDDFENLVGSPGKLNVGVTPKKAKSKVTKVRRAQGQSNKQDGKATLAGPPKPILKFNLPQNYQEDGGLFCLLKVDKMMEEYKSRNAFKDDKGEDTEGPSWAHINGGLCWLTPVLIL